MEPLALVVFIAVALLFDFINGFHDAANSIATVVSTRVLIGTAVAGIPVRTTHTITGAIVGVGATTRLSAVRWGIAGRIVWAWILTNPAAGLIAGMSSALLGWLR